MLLLHSAGNVYIYIGTLNPLQVGCIFKDNGEQTRFAAKCIQKTPEVIK
jgi:hypothetical protein